MSDEHFTVDGTLIQAWASQKSFHSKDGSDDDGGSFHGQKRSNQTHASTTDGDARLYKKSYGKESKLSYLGHVLVENRNGLIADAMVTTADGTAERDAALLMLRQKQQHRSRRITVGADKAYDSEDFVRTVRELNVTPHVTKNDNRRASNLDRRTTRHAGYAISLRERYEVGANWDVEGRQASVSRKQRDDARENFKTTSPTELSRRLQPQPNLPASSRGV